MEEHTGSSEEKPKQGPNPLLFYIMLGIIVASIVIFMSLSRPHVGSGSKTTTTPSSK